MWSGMVSCEAVIPEAGRWDGFTETEWPGMIEWWINRNRCSKGKGEKSLQSSFHSSSTPLFSHFPFRFSCFCFHLCLCFFICTSFIATFSFSFSPFLSSLPYPSSPPFPPSSLFPPLSLFPTYMSLPWGIEMREGLVGPGGSGVPGIEETIGGDICDIYRDETKFRHRERTRPDTRHKMRLVRVWK